MITPGEKLSQWIKDSDYSISEVGNHLDLSDSMIGKFIDGKVSFRGYFTKLEDLTSIPQTTWEKLQKDYENKKNT